MMIIRLTYFSRNRLGEWYGSSEIGISEILAASVANNLRDCITGALIHADQWFIQTLEGPENKVSAAFERILRDQRHRDVSLVTMQVVPERRYPNIAMTCVARDQDNDEIFRHYGEDERFDPRQMRPDRLSDLIEAVVHRKTGVPTWTNRRATNAA